MAHVVVIVLGDTGRSPRMQYHAISLSEMAEISRVTLIGYEGEKCNQIIEKNKKIIDLRISTSSKMIEIFRVIGLLHAVIKGIYLVLSILYTLVSLPHIHLILIQNPPSIPAALASLFLSYFTGTIIVIDWHNLGYSLYLDRYKETHLLVILSKYLEGLICSACHYHICVSNAMSKWLKKTYFIDASVLYDRPPASVFNRLVAALSTSNSSSVPSLSSSLSSTTTPSLPPTIPIDTRHNLLMKLELTDEKLFPFHPIQKTSSNALDTLSPASPSSSFEGLESSWIIERTIQTIKYKIPQSLVGSLGDEIITLIRPDRAVLLVSSTSWSPDEDFSILMRALQNLDRSLVKRRGEGKSKDRTRVVVVITGKGPMKESFLREWSELQQREKDRLSYISLTSLWLESSDYPLLLALCDMGICLHTSSSGLDLPMKILDMFGSGIPVCAFYYSTLPELVKNGENGIIFRSHSDLAAHLYRLYCESPNDMRTIDEMNKMKRNAYQIGNWESNWNSLMIPLVRDCLALHSTLRPSSSSSFSPLLLILLTGLVVVLAIFYSHYHS